MGSKGLLLALCAGLVLAAGCATDDGVMKRETDNAERYVQGAGKAIKQVGTEVADGVEDLVDKMKGD